MHKIYSKITYCGFIIIFMGCTTIHPKGFISNESSKIIIKKPTVTGNDHSAIVLRDSTSNGFNLRISPEIDTRISTSFYKSSFNIYMLFETTCILPNEVPIIYIPALESNNFEFVKSLIQKDLKGIITLYKCNSLGKDLLLTNALSSGGIKGVAQFTNNNINVPLELNINKDFFIWSSLYLKESRLWGASIIIRSEVEYPIYVSDIEVKIKNKNKKKKVGRLLKPWNQIAIYLCPNSLDINWPSLRINKFSIRNIPNKFYN